MKSTVIVLFVISSFHFSLPAQADVKYSVTDVGVFGGSIGGAPHDVNISGQVVGFASTINNNYHAFLYSSGSIQDICGTSSYAYKINDNGEVVGDCDNQAFLYSANGGLKNLGTLGGSRSAAYGINNNGQVVGEADMSYSYHYSSHAFLYNSGGMIDLGTLGGATSQARTINNKGLIVGWADTSSGTSHAFLYDGNGPMKDLGTLGGSWSWAFSINDHGQIVGYSTYINDNPGPFGRAVLWNGNDPPKYLGSLGGETSGALDINNNGQIVGWAETSSSGNDSHAFIYDGNGPMQDLNNMIDPASGWTLNVADAINDQGQIACQGYKPGEGYRPILLTPVPEPSTMLLLLISFISLMLYARRKR
jgi:probable HAF family extracellular repeat protein